MINEVVEKKLNDQINEEISSAYIYLSMASYFESLNLKGFANWMNVQVKEEMTHAEKFINYINSRGGRVQLKAIPAPAFEWKSPEDAFMVALKHENHITKCINDIYNIATEHKDHATKTFLQWFINEQVEEEQNANDIVCKLKLVNNTPAGLFMVDAELAKRVFVPPTTGAADAAGA